MSALGRPWHWCRATLWPPPLEHCSLTPPLAPGDHCAAARWNPAKVPRSPMRTDIVHHKPPALGPSLPAPCLHCVPCPDHIGHLQPWTLCCHQHNIFRPQEAEIILVITTTATSLAAFIKQFTRWTYAFYAIFWAGSSFKLNNIQNTSSSLWQQWGRCENEPAGSIFHMFKAVQVCSAQLASLLSYIVFNLLILVIGYNYMYL